MKRFRINPISIVVWVWLVIMNGIVVATNYFFAILIHELGHFITAKKCGYKVSRFSLSPYGVELSYLDQNINFRDEMLIAFAGPLANFLSLFFVLGVWWIFPSVYFVTESFVTVSFLIALFNLLPAYPLDGGRIFVCIASNFMSGKVAKKFTIFSNLFLGSLFFVGFVVCLFINFNPSLMLFSLFLFAGVLDLKWVSKFDKINIFSKGMKNFSRPTFYCVNEQTSLKELIAHIENSKTVVFCLVFENGKIINLSENMIKKLALNFSYETKLKEIFNK